MTYFNLLYPQGNETTGVAISHALLFLAIHPEYQEKAYQEIKNVIGSESKDLSHKDLIKLEYCEMVIKETLRHGKYKFKT